jgi:uncharacterized membrane protein YsdA (DUF1294 family)
MAVRKRRKQTMSIAIAAYFCLAFVMSCIALFAYGFDKRRAANGDRRVPERTLHILALLGGWPGALMGQRQFRHKTNKISFLVVFWVTVVLHLAVVGSAAYLLFDWSKVEASVRSRPMNSQ